MVRKAVIYDFETTGLFYRDNPHGNRVVEAAFIKFDMDSGDVLDTLESCFNPEGKKSHPMAYKTHKIKDSDLLNKPKFKDKAQEILDFIGDAPVAGHNIKNFDNKMMKYELDKADPTGRMSSFFENRNFIDTLELSKEANPEERKHNLDVVSQRLGVDTSSRESRHGAMIDIGINLDVLKEFRNQGHGHIIDRMAGSAAVVNIPQARPVQQEIRAANNNGDIDLGSNDSQRSSDSSSRSSDKAFIDDSSESVDAYVARANDSDSSYKDRGRKNKSVASARVAGIEESSSDEMNKKQAAASSEQSFASSDIRRYFVNQSQVNNNAATQSNMQNSEEDSKLPALPPELLRAQRQVESRADDMSIDSYLASSSDSSVEKMVIDRIPPFVSASRDAGSDNDSYLADSSGSEGRAPIRIAGNSVDSSLDRRFANINIPPSSENSRVDEEVNSSYARHIRSESSGDKDTKQKALR